MLFGALMPGEDVHRLVTSLRPGMKEIHGVYLQLFALVQFLIAEEATRRGR